MGHGGRPHLHCAVPSGHRDRKPRGRPSGPGRSRRRTRPRPCRVGGPGIGRRACVADSGREASSPGRRRARRPNDDPGLGAHHAKGGGRCHRRWRNDLPCGHRLSGAWCTRSRRCPQRNHCPARRRAGDGRRRPGSRDRRSHGSGGRGVRAPSHPGRTGHGGARHPDLREPRVRRARRRSGGPAGRWCRASAGRIHGHRRPWRCASPPAARAGRTEDVCREHGQVAPADHTRLRATSGGLPEHRLPVQRILRTSRAATSSSPKRRTP